MFDFTSLPAVPGLPQSMLTNQIHLALAGYEGATGMAGLSHNLPMSFLFAVPRRRQTKLWLPYRTSLTAGQKEAAESLSCLQNLLQQEEF